MECKITFYLTNGQYLTDTFNEEASKQVHSVMISNSSTVGVKIKGTTIDIIKSNILYVTYEEVS